MGRGTSGSGLGGGYWDVSGGLTYIYVNYCEQTH